jgi:hypothetical protein
MLHLKLLEKQEQANPKKKQKERNNIFKGWNQEIEKKKHVPRINEIKTCFFEKLKKIDRPLANLTKMRRKKIQISKIRNAKGETTTNTMEIK